MSLKTEIVAVGSHSKKCKLSHARPRADRYKWAQIPLSEHNNPPQLSYSLKFSSMAPTTRANTRAIRRAPPYILPPPSASLQYLSSTPPSPTPAPQTSLSTLEPDRFYSQPHRQPIASSSSLLSSSAPGPSRPSRHASSSSAVLEELHTLASSFLPWDVFKEREQPHKAEQREMNTLHSFHTTPEPHLEPIAL